MEKIAVLGAALVLAFLIESMAEYIAGTWWKPGEDGNRAKTIQACTLAAGIGLALGFQVDLLTLVGLNNSILGQVATGVIIGRGSDFVHKFAENFLAGK